MIFRKNIEHLCIYCEHAFLMRGEECACRKRGLVNKNYSCRKFVYDPFKRIPPPKAPKLPEFSDEDFKI